MKTFKMFQHVHQGLSWSRTKKRRACLFAWAKSGRGTAFHRFPSRWIKEAGQKGTGWRTRSRRYNISFLWTQIRVCVILNEIARRKNELRCLFEGKGAIKICRNCEQWNESAQCFRRYLPVMCRSLAITSYRIKKNCESVTRLLIILTGSKVLRAYVYRNQWWLMYPLIMLYLVRDPQE